MIIAAWLDSQCFCYRCDSELTSALPLKIKWNSFLECSKWLSISLSRVRFYYNGSGSKEGGESVTISGQISWFRYSSVDPATHCFRFEEKIFCVGDTIIYLSEGCGSPRSRPQKRLESLYQRPLLLLGVQSPVSLWIFLKNWQVVARTSLASEVGISSSDDLSHGTLCGMKRYMKVGL